MWLVSLGIVLTVAILLGSVGVPSRVIQVGTVSALIVLVVVLWVIGRSGRADD